MGLGLKKCADYLTGFKLILWYIVLGLIKLINQVEMLSEKYEDFLELSVKQLLIKLSPIVLDQIICGWKKKCINVVSSKVSYVDFKLN